MIDENRFDKFPPAEKIIASPFPEIPTHSTLSEEQLRYVQTVAATLTSAFWEGQIRRSRPPLETAGPHLADLTTIKETLDQRPHATVYTHSQSYPEQRDGPRASRIIPKDRYDKTKHTLVQVGATVSVKEKGGYLYFSYNDTHTRPIGAPQIRALFDAGIPVSLAELLTYSPHEVGLEIANTKTRKRLGEGISVDFRGRPKREKYVVLKLPKPDAEGNIILMQKVE